MVDKESNGSLALELGSCSFMTGNGVVGYGFVGEHDLDPMLTRATVVGFLVYLRSLLFPQQLLSWTVRYGLPTGCNLCCKFVNDGS